MQQKPITVQQSLFPETITLSPAKSEMVKELKPELLKLGYDLESIDGTHFAVNGTPVDEEEDVQQVIDAFLESYQSNMFLHRADKESNMAMSMAKQKCNMFKPMTEMCEIRDFLRQLFDCQLSNVSPGGKKIIHQIGENEIEKWFD
jgi:DNA mismatch repair protein MutL